MWHYRWIFDRRSVALLLPGAAVGIAAGTLFFGYSLDNTAILRTGVGVLALVWFNRVIYGVLLVTGVKLVAG